MGYTAGGGIAGLKRKRKESQINKFCYLSDL